MGKVWEEVLDWMTRRVSTGIVCSSSNGRTWEGASGEGTWFRTRRKGVERSSSKCGCSFLGFLAKGWCGCRISPEIEERLNKMFGKMLNRTEVSKLIKHIAFRKSSELRALEVGKTPGERIVLRFSERYFYKQTNNVMKFGLGVWLSKYTYNMPLPC